MENIAGSGLDFESFPLQADGDPMRIYWSLRGASEFSLVLHKERELADDCCVAPNLAATASSC